LQISVLFITELKKLSSKTTGNLALTLLSKIAANLPRLGKGRTIYALTLHLPAIMQHLLHHFKFSYLSVARVGSVGKKELYISYVLGVR
jgi:hypothetical protein